MPIIFPGKYKTLQNHHNMIHLHRCLFSPRGRTVWRRSPSPWTHSSSHPSTPHCTRPTPRACGAESYGSPPNSSRPGTSETLWDWSLEFYSESLSHYHTVSSVDPSFSLTNQPTDCLKISFCFTTRVSPCANFFLSFKSQCWCYYVLTHVPGFLIEWKRAVEPYTVISTVYHELCIYILIIYFFSVATEPRVATGSRYF